VPLFLFSDVEAKARQGAANMKAISEVIYTPDGKPYQCVSFDDDELSSMVRLEDIPSDVEIEIVPFQALPFEASSPVESLPERDSSPPPCTRESSRTSRT
jgi:hypothetical protein